MANTITGKIHFIGATQSIPTKNGQPFIKRDLILDTTRFDPYTGERGYENYPMLEFNGEKCKDLDRYKVGQVVTVSFDLQGGFFDAQDGTKKNFTRVRAYKIEARAVAANAPKQEVQQNVQPQPQYQQPVQQPQYQPQYRPNYQQTQGGTPPPPRASDLPF